MQIGVLNMANLRRLPFFNLFMPKKRKGRGTMWASLIGLGVSAAVFGITRGKRSNVALPFTNAIRNMTPKMNVGRMDNAALTEFSDELLASSLKNDKR
jgi:hypothetical protein